MPSELVALTPDEKNVPAERCSIVVASRSVLNRFHLLIVLLFLALTGQRPSGQGQFPL